MRGIVLAVALASRAAAAQPEGLMSRDDDKAEADRLFEEGRTLQQSGKLAEACKLFELSHRKDPSAVGTILNLGLCAEQSQLFATAVRYYAEARDRAHDQ